MAKKCWQSCFTPPWLMPSVHPLPASTLVPCKARELGRVQGDLQAGGDQGQCDTSPAGLCLFAGRATGGTGAPLLIPCIKTLASVLHFCWVSGVAQPSCLSFAVSLGIIYKFGVTGSRGENCLFILEWSPEVPVKIWAHLLLSLNKCRVQGSACSAPHQQARQRQETRIFICLHLQKGKGVKPVRLA